MTPLAFYATLLALTSAGMAAPTLEPSFPEVLYHVSIKVVDGMISILGSDGVYTSYNDTHMAYLGLPTSHLESRSPLPLGDSALLPRDGCSTNCNGQYTDGNTISAAQAGLRNHFSSYPNWSKSVVYISGNVYAFGCDYGHGQNTPPTQYDVDVDCVTNACGPSQAGWNSRRSWKASYGREISGFKC